MISRSSRTKINHFMDKLHPQFLASICERKSGLYTYGYGNHFIYVSVDLAEHSCFRN